jgi:hypothetical protein
MSDDLSELNFRQDLEEALQAEDAKRWKIERVGPLEVYVSLSPVQAPAEIFQARLLWRVYPGEPPSLKFRDPATGRLDLPSAWPVVRGFRPQCLDACVNWCLEGFAIHPEWRNDPTWKWSAAGNVVLKVIRRLQDDLDFHFVNRFGK